MDKKKIKAVCDYVIHYMEREGQFLNVVKLQRLLYVAYAWHLAFFGQKKLFRQPFEAWKFGPINRIIHDRFAEYLNISHPITVADCWYSRTEEALAQLSAAEIGHLDNILNTYGTMSAFELEEMLRYEEPWRLARVGLREEEPSSRAIPDETIYAYYKRVARL